MRPKNESLAAEILKVAKAEFLEMGYRKASLRNIAASVGVTTGAIYRYYANKETLFDALVAEPADTFYAWYRDLRERNAERDLEEQLDRLSDPFRDSEQARRAFEYIYRHYDAFKLIACCAEGTKYEQYMERLIEVENRSTGALVHRMHEAGRLDADVDETMIHIIASSMFTAYFEIIAHVESVEVAAHHLVTLREFYKTGWLRLLGVA